jgi:hypothetical protein
MSRPKCDLVLSVWVFCVTVRLTQRFQAPKSVALHLQSPSHANPHTLQFSSLHTHSGKQRTLRRRINYSRWINKLNFSRARHLSRRAVYILRDELEQQQRGAFDRGELNSMTSARHEILTRNASVALRGFCNAHSSGRPNELDDITHDLVSAGCMNFKAPGGNFELPPPALRRNGARGPQASERERLFHFIKMPPSLWRIWPLTAIRDECTAPAFMSGIGGQLDYAWVS